MQHSLSGSCHEVHHASLRGDQARRVSQRPEPGDFGVASDMHLRRAPFLPTVPAGQAGLRASSRHTMYAVWRVRPRKSNGIFPITTSSRTRHETTQFISCWRALSLFADSCKNGAAGAQARGDDGGLTFTSVAERVEWVYSSLIQACS